MAKELIFKGKLVALSIDHLGYINRVFENLDAKTIEDLFIMCVLFPNWNLSPININDVGFVSVRKVIAGLDTWFDGANYVNYKSSDVHFLKFIPLPEKKELDIKL